MTDKTYVYEDTEVKLTGRIAHRKLKSGKIDLKHEITPADSMLVTWKKWVEFSALYEIQGNKNENT